MVSVLHKEQESKVEKIKYIRVVKVMQQQIKANPSF